MTFSSILPSPPVCGGLGPLDRSTNGRAFTRAHGEGSIELQRDPPRAESVGCKETSPRGRAENGAAKTMKRVAPRKRRSRVRSSPRPPHGRPPPNQSRDRKGADSARVAIVHAPEPGQLVGTRFGVPLRSLGW